MQSNYAIRIYPNDGELQVYIARDGINFIYKSNCKNLNECLEIAKEEITKQELKAFK